MPDYPILWPGRKKGTDRSVHPALGYGVFVQGTVAPWDREVPIFRGYIERKMGTGLREFYFAG